MEPTGWREAPPDDKLRAIREPISTRGRPRISLHPGCGYFAEPLIRRAFARKLKNAQHGLLCFRAIRIAERINMGQHKIWGGQMMETEAGKPLGYRLSKLK